MENEIMPVGPIPAKICLVGESPGETEIKEGKPFVGMAGKILDGILEEAGIVRDQCYITNIMLTRPPGNDFGKFYEDKARRQPTVQLQEGIRRLHEEIVRAQPNIVVALGEEPMRALTGKRGIGDWRGSVLQGVTGHKVIPTFHPAAVGREWTFRPAAVIDLIKAKEQSVVSNLVSTSRSLHTLRVFTEVILTLQALRKAGGYVAFDIETESNQVTSIAFAPADRPHWAVCVPFWFGGSGSLWSQDEEVEIWNEIKGLLTDPQVKTVAHNGSYDIEFLSRTMGIEVTNFAFDTMLGMHVMYLELPKSLAFAVSIYTDHPYYKYQLKTASMDEYFRYNATDACLTMEIANKLIEEIEQEGLWEFYQDYLQALVVPLLTMQKRGVKFDYLKRNSVKKRYQEEIAVLQKNVNAAAGRDINVNSPKQMKEWLYGKSEGCLGLKVRTKKRKASGEETVAADEEALQALYKESENATIKTILKIRERQKILSTYLEVKLDEDKRIRCSYLITGTETGRLSSRGTLHGTGTNLQNIPSGVIRSLFVADEGKVLINADLSQAEARVVAYLANETRLIRVFEDGGDIHRKNAANIFAVKEDQVTDEQRQLAKRVVHASNYGMGPRTFATTAGIKEADAKRLLNQYFATYPGIANWHHSIRNDLQRRRYLITPLGRKRYFYNRWNDSLFKEGLAFIPQSTVADIVNQGLIEAHKKGLELLLQVHDSLLVQTSQEMVNEHARLLQECLTRPVEINGKILSIPCDIKVGVNWNEMTKWKS